MAQAAVTLDAIGPSGGGGAGGGNPASPITWTHVVSGSGTALYLGCSVGIYASGHTAGNQDGDFVITAVTIDGIPMTLIAGPIHAGGQHAGYTVLYRLAAPTAGSHTASVAFINVNAQGSDAIECGSLSFNGVDPTTPESNLATATGNSTTPSVSVSSASGNLVLDIVVNGSAISASNQTQRWNKTVNNFTAGGNGAQSTAAGAATVAMGYTVVSDLWAMIGLSINATAPVLTHPKTVTVSWRANPEPDIAQYWLYRYTGSCAQPGTWVLVQTYGVVTSGTDRLPDYGIYCYALTAVNTAGLESAKSTPFEIAYTAPVPQYLFRFGSRSMGFKQ